MNELQQLFSFETDEQEYKGIIRVYKHFEGHWLMEIAVDLSEESSASRKVIPWRNDRLPRLLQNDLFQHQRFLIDEFRAAYSTGNIKADEVIYGARMEIPLNHIIEFDKVLDERIAKAEAEKRAENGH